MRKAARKPREREIIANALAILRREGNAALSMRAVAGATGISLSNVQYYFRDKEALLVALVEHYFDQCEAFLVARTGEFGRGGLEDAIFDFLQRMLSEDHELVEMCATFREIWAIATRSSQVAAALEDYYQRVADLIGATLLKAVPDAAVRARIVNLLLPYLEGFTLTGPLSGQSVEDSARMLAQIVVSASGSESAKT